MPLPETVEKRASERLAISCPVTLSVRGRGTRPEVTEAVLEEIGIGGARVSVPHPLEVGTPVTLDVHFSHPDGSIATVRFEGVVARASQNPRYDIAVRFRRRGRFLRDRIVDSLGIEYLAQDGMGQAPPVS
jgi:hypothetical protein